VHSSVLLFYLKFNLTTIAIFTEKQYNGVMKKENKIIDKRKLRPDDVVAIPNDLIDKGYIKLFNKKALEAVMDLMKQSYRAGLQIGREETKSYYEKELDKIYK
jgi:hypothetical protein